MITSCSRPDYRERLEKELAELGNEEIWRTGKAVRALRPGVGAKRAASKKKAAKPKRKAAKPAAKRRPAAKRVAKRAAKKRARR